MQRRLFTDTAFSRSSPRPLLKQENGHAFLFLVYKFGFLAWVQCVEKEIFQIFRVLKIVLWSTCFATLSTSNTAKSLRNWSLVSTMPDEQPSSSLSLRNLSLAVTLEEHYCAPGRNSSIQRWWSGLKTFMHPLEKFDVKRFIRGLITVCVCFNLLA